MRLRAEGAVIARLGDYSLADKTNDRYPDALRASALEELSQLGAAMTKFGVVFILVLVVAAVSAAGQRATSSSLRLASGVLANQRLTSVVGALLFLLVVAIAGTTLSMPQFLSAHYLVGVLMLPLVVLKIGTTGYRFARYYSRATAYRLAGPPAQLQRLLVAPVLVASTLAVFATGIELWLFGLRFGSFWTTAHTLSAVAFMFAIGGHLLAHLRRSAEAAVAETTAPRSRPVATRRVLVLGTLLFGVVLAGVSVLYATPFPPASAG